MRHRPDQVMLTLAGLAYRGFHDLGRGAAHPDAVRQALLDGLHTLPPVKDEWNLVWGPVTSRSGPDAFDSAAMYVVRYRRTPARYVVAIRGTNPVAASDWLFGDFWVSTTVPWPYARTADGVAVSASTALGLSKLQAMRSPRLPSEPAGAEGRPAVPREALERQVAGIAAGWCRFVEGPSAWLEDRVVDRLKTAVGLPACPATRSQAPTAGNAAFAKRIDRVLEHHHHHLRNTNDVVTHAWQAEELAQIPKLYAPRHTVLQPLIPLIASRVKGLDYRQAREGVRTFAGALDPARSFAAEFIHQHLDAYLDELDLRADGLDAPTLFF